MIDQLRKRLIGISALSVILVFTLIYIGIWIVGVQRLNSTIDALADLISTSEGTFPSFFEENLPQNEGSFAFLTQEVPLSTSYFTVKYDLDGNIVSEDVSSIPTVDQEAARRYAEQAMRSEKERGWIDGCRFKKYDTDTGPAVIFLDGTINRFFTRMLLLTVGGVLLAGLVLILALIVLFSKRGVKPVVESYERQKQFITDANHELKMPLTLILANLDIIETEIGENEWLIDIRAAGERMNALLKQLVTLTRMDEEQTNLNFSPFSLSDAIVDTVSEFKILAQERRKPITADVQPGITYVGEEAGIRRMIAILLDNALKYCDPGGNISLRLTAKRHPVICVENTYKEVDSIELDKLFDRFYRVDKARTFTGGFGIGLSIAKSVVEKHRGEIRAYKKGHDCIGFRVVLR